jgi:ATP-dependent protease ClpP protease subunit
MKWFKAKAEGSVTKITIDGQIGIDWWDGSGTSSHAFMQAVKGLGEVSEIQIDMNSPGGAVSDGLTIANYLRQHDAKVVVNVLGQASSIASVIAAAADEVRMGLGAYMFIHNPWTVAVGNADQLRALALDLDTIATGILEVYVARVGEEKRAELQELIAGTDGDGTLLSAEMALELGLADSMLETRAAASKEKIFEDLSSAITQAKQGLEAKMQGAQQPRASQAALALAEAFGVTPEEAEARAHELGEQIVGLMAAQPGIVEGFNITAESLAESHPDVVSAIEAAALRRGPNAEDLVAAERHRVVAIVKACQTMNQPKLLEKLIANGMAEESAIEYVTDVAAASDPGIHSSHSPEGGHQPVIDMASIYARRKRNQ